MVNRKEILFSFAEMESDNPLFHYECSRQILTRFSCKDGYANTDKMEYLFYGIATLPPERKVHYIKLLLEHNPSYEMFESLPLFPLVTSWSNSAVPYLTSRINYMEQILPILPGLKFIKHKRRIEGIIDGLREQIRQEEIRDILNS
jgi:hypothetical protein